MAKHSTPASMLKESLFETLEAAKFCSDYRKNDKKWGSYNTGGCLGYPGAILLFSIIDSIGSYFRKDKTFKIPIDNKQMTIDSDGWQHFKVLNSKYFNQTLSEKFIQEIYNRFRSCLTHNSVLGKNSMMIMDNQSLNQGVSNQAFFIAKTADGKVIYMISIKELWELCDNAINDFYKEIDKIVPASKQGKDFH